MPYLSLDNEEVKIPPNSNKKLKIILDTGKKKITSGKYSALIFSSRAIEKKSNDNEAKLGVVGKIVTSVFILPNKGKVKRQGNIKSFSANSSVGLNTDLFGLKKFPGFELSYINKGNTHLNIEGEIYVESLTGKEVSKIRIPKFIVYPGTARTINIPWVNSKNGFFKAKADVLAYLYDYKNEQSTAKQSFYNISSVILLGLPLLIIFVSLIVFIKVKRKKRRKRIAKLKRQRLL